MPAPCIRSLPRSFSSGFHLNDPKLISKVASNWDFWTTYSNPIWYIKWNNPQMLPTMQAHPRSLAESLRDHFHRQGLRGTMEDYIANWVWQKVSFQLGVRNSKNSMYNWIWYDITVFFLKQILQPPIFWNVGPFWKDSLTQPPFNVNLHKIASIHEIFLIYFARLSWVLLAKAPREVFIGGFEASTHDEQAGGTNTWIWATTRLSKYWNNGFL